MVDYRRVMREVRRVIRDHDITEPPVDPIAIAQSEGIAIKGVTFSGEFSEVSGFYDPRENAIYVNNDEFPLRRTFTIAHELGHALIHRSWAATAAYTVLWRDQSRNADDSNEKEANAFAAHLLVPRFMLDEYRSRVSVAGLSELFAVSVPVIRNRLKFEYGV